MAVVEVKLIGAIFNIEFMIGVGFNYCLNVGTVEAHLVVGIISIGIDLAREMNSRIPHVGGKTIIQARSGKEVTNMVGIVVDML